MDQEALMESDQLLAVDANDILISGAALSKRDGHTFDAATPRGVLHRAFSFFLFDRERRMLLTRRANSKITFPGVWTNTVCSHPLTGIAPSEVDATPAAYPAFPGVKNAAVRKCRHELGIGPDCVRRDGIRFITRFHYWAADTLTYGKDAPWGEHEVDYVLFYQTDRDIPVAAAPDEVGDYKFVSIDELRDMLKQPELTWSPWFLGILERGGWDWWEDLEGALAGKYTNDVITYFDPPVEHTASYNLPSHNRHDTGILRPKGP
jgi:isopentenyl-diphosphate delta-isomerase